ncbi:TPA: hypothetical protein N2G40_000393 [Salmonella enterica]|uniref:O-antigen polymerase n=1 Tax=Salmonella enterica TaxID=28901 RepID=U3GLV2_SALER|nr:O-antigen polymerase [Salmonella enterica]HCL5277184.1 hypothetical protein [Salmonella enterica]
MLLFYWFLYVFSLSIPIFYHSAFLVGFVSAIHYLLIYKRNLLVLSRYQIFYFSSFLLGYIIVGLIIILNETYDISFFKTYTNSFLSAISGVPLVLIFLERFGKNAPAYVMKYTFYIFIIQSIIIILVLFVPALKPFVMYFQRNAELASELDLFSNGLRTNALSGGLFYGLSLSFSMAIILYLYYILVYKFQLKLRYVFLFTLVNIGLICTGRFGFIYVICIIPIICTIKITRKIKLILFSLCMIVLLCILFFTLYELFPQVKKIYNETIYPYAFEFLSNYQKSGDFDTSSTNELASMYNVTITDNTWFFGDGLYTGNDGLYYQHTDVGYLRLLLLGGVGLNIYFISFTVLMLIPILKSTLPNNKSLYFSLLLLFLLSQFKGEAMITLVQLNNMCFILCSTISFLYRKDVNE